MKEERIPRQKIQVPGRHMEYNYIYIKSPHRRNQTMLEVRGKYIGDETIHKTRW